MKKIFFAITIITLFTISCKEDKTKKTETTDAKEVNIAAKAESNDIKIDKGTISWVGYKPTDSHNGTINFKEGNLKMDGDKLVGGSFVVDMNSIKVSDIKDEKYNAKLVKHLSSEDFFDVAKFPTSTFEITSVTPDGDKLNVEGNITIKGITKNIKFPATFSNKDGVLTFKGETVKIDRTEFGIEFHSAKDKLFDVKKFKDQLIKDIFDVSVEFTAKK